MNETVSKVALCCPAVHFGNVLGMLHKDFIGPYIRFLLFSYCVLPERTPILKKDFIVYMVTITVQPGKDCVIFNRQLTVQAVEKTP